MMGTLVIKSLNVIFFFLSHPHSSINLLGALSLSIIFVEFSLKIVHPTMVGKYFQIYVAQIPGKCTCKSKY